MFALIPVCLSFPWAAKRCSGLHLPPTSLAGAYEAQHGALFTFQSILILPGWITAGPWFPLGCVSGAAAPSPPGVPPSPLLRRVLSQSGLLIWQKRDVNEGQKMRDANEGGGKAMLQPPQVTPPRLIFVVLCLDVPPLMKMSSAWAEG